MKLTKNKLLETIRRLNEGWSVYQVRKIAGISVGYVYEIWNKYKKAGDALPEGEDCKIDVGNDLVVWTKHFTEFVTYTTIPEDLKLWLPFNGNADDESGNGNNGIVYGASLTTDKDGNPDAAYYFDGADDYIYAGASNFGIETTNEFTISLWVNPESYTYLDTIIMKGDYAYPFWIRLKGNTKYHPGVAGLRSVVRTSGTYYISSDYNRFNFGEWYHIAMTYKDGLRVVYIDGVEDGSDSVSGALHFGYPSNGENSISTCIGKSCKFSEKIFNGKIDDVRIYNRALSADEIAGLYG